MIEWERSATGHVETLVVWCDGCGVYSEASVSRSLLEEYSRTSIVATYRDNARIFTDADGKDRCEECHRKLRGQASSTHVTKHGTIVYVGDGWATTPAQARAEMARVVAMAVQCDREDRFRAAMQGMANVMRGVVRAWEAGYADVRDLQTVQRAHDGKLLALLSKDEKERMSAEWSRRVREGVKALRPPGPVVACHGDWEDD